MNSHRHPSDSMLRQALLPAFAAALFLFGGCGGHSSPRASDSQAHAFVAAPPHGGTAAPVGDDYQIEFVLDPAAGKMDAYVMDDELENFVRIKPPSFDVTAKLAGGQEVLHFAAVANSATGETVGNTSQFEAQADWLKATNPFDGIIQEINVEGTVFNSILFRFPKGNAADEKPKK